MARRRYLPTAIDRKTQRRAREEILAAANDFRRTVPGVWTVLRAKHLQRAVCICRRNRLVKLAVLERAGFRAAE